MTVSQNSNAEILQKLYGVPGYRGIREQAKALVAWEMRAPLSMEAHVRLVQDLSSPRQRLDLAGITGKLAAGLERTRDRLSTVTPPALKLTHIPAEEEKKPTATPMGAPGYLQLRVGLGDRRVESAATLRAKVCVATAEVVDFLKRTYGHKYVPEKRRPVVDSQKVHRQWVREHFGDIFKKPEKKTPPPKDSPKDPVKTFRAVCWRYPEGPFIHTTTPAQPPRENVLEKGCVLYFKIGEQVRAEQKAKRVMNEVIQSGGTICSSESLEVMSAEMKHVLLMSRDPVDDGN